MRRKKRADALSAAQTEPLRRADCICPRMGEENFEQTRCVGRSPQKTCGMDTTSWQDRFDLKTCTAAGITKAIPAKALGVAVIYTRAAGSEKTFLVLESRSGSLRDLCAKRLATAKIPAGTKLSVAFKTVVPADTAPAAVGAACREQFILAGALRRELRPAMR